MSAIFLKEIRSYFKSLFGWIFLAVFTFFAGEYFVANNIQYGSPYIRDSLSPLVIVLVFILPLLTMRIIADEKRQKTDQFLITAPISLVKVILGKFFALCAIMLAATLFMAAGAGIMAIYGKIPLLETVFALLGFFLFGCECIAIGMFLSSITEHQFLAAIFTYAVYFFSMLVPSFCSYIFGADKAVCKVLNVFDFFTPFEGMLSGVVNLKDVLYFISVIAIFLILSYKVFAKNSVQFSAMSKNRFFVSSLLPFVIIGAIVGANIGCHYIPAKFTEFDITKNGLYTITDDTKQVLDSLNEDITIYVISSKEEADDAVKHYVDAYSSRSSHIKVEYRSPADYPGFVSKYTDSALSYSSMIVEKGNDYRVIEYNDMFEYTYDYSTFAQSVTGLDVEGQMTASINSLMNGENNVKVYYLTGHDEFDLPSYLTETLKKSGYGFNELLLMGKEIPEDCDILFINGPMSDLSEAEVEKIIEYVDNGGKLIMTNSIELYKCTNYDSLLKHYGVDVTEGTVVERDYRYMFAADMPSAILTFAEETSPYVAGTNKVNLLYRSRGLKYDPENPVVGVGIDDIFVSSSMSYATVLGEAENIEYSDGDETGPFSLGLDITVYNEETGTTGEIIAISSGIFLKDEIDSIVSHGNSDLVIDACKSMADNSLIVTIPAKQMTYEFISVSAAMVFVYVALFCAVVPLILIVTGIVILIVRRRK